MHEQDKVNKVWVYSVASSGKLRAQWQLTEDEFETLRIHRTKPIQAAEEEAQAAIRQLMDQVIDQDLATIRRALIDYVAQSDTWSAATTKERDIGMHFIVIDHSLPGGHLLLSTFSIPSKEQLSADQVAQLVNTVINGGGRCCT